MIELYIPFAYAVKREIIRFRIGFYDALGFVISNQLLTNAWILVFLFILKNVYSNVELYLVAAINIGLFITLYEIGYIISDYVGYKYERDDIGFSAFYGNSFVGWHLLSSVFLRLALIFGAAWLLQDCLVIPWQGYLTVLMVFIFHVSLKNEYRIITFTVLRILKGFVPYWFIISSAEEPVIATIFITIIAINSYYLIDYGARKIGIKTTKNKLMTNRNPHLKILIGTVVGSLYLAIISADKGLLLTYLASMAIFHSSVILMRKVVKKITCRVNNYG